MTRAEIESLLAHITQDARELTVALYEVLEVVREVRRTMDKLDAGEYASFDEWHDEIRVAIADGGDDAGE